MSTIALWRIGTDTPDYTADDLSGKGAELTGGRWNRSGLPMVYAASSVALAALETLVHLQLLSLPLNRYLVRLEVPKDLWAARERWSPATLPVGWDALPAGMVSMDTGDAWLKGAASALCEVPSVIVPEESNVLLNPTHPQAGRIRAVKLRRWTYDGRLRGSA